MDAPQLLPLHRRLLVTVERAFLLALRHTDAHRADSACGRGPIEAGMR